MILLARVIVYLATEITKESFWEYWKEIHEAVYHDENMKDYASWMQEAEWKSFHGSASSACQNKRISSPG